jgi:hypothetical protein
VLELLTLTGKNAPPIVKNKISKKGQHCGEHSGDVAVLACQDKE